MRHWKFFNARGIDDGLMHASMGRRVAILLIADARAEFIGSATAPKEDAAIRCAGQVVNREAVRGEALVILPPDARPLLRCERFRKTDEGVHWEQGSMKLAEFCEIGFAREDDCATGAQFTGRSD